MRLPRSKRYHAWEGTTPIVDVVPMITTSPCAVMGSILVAVLIGCYVVIFAAIAVRDGNPGLALQYGAFLVACGLALVAAYVFRRWRRHNG